MKSVRLWKDSCIYNYSVALEDLAFGNICLVCRLLKLVSQSNKVQGGRRGLCVSEVAGSKNFEWKSYLALRPLWNIYISAQRWWTFHHHREVHSILRFIYQLSKENMALKIHQLEMKQSTQAKKHQNHTGEEVIYHSKHLEKYFLTTSMKIVKWGKSGHWLGVKFHKIFPFP